MKVRIFGEYKTGTTALYKLIFNNFPHQNPRELFEKRSYQREKGDNQSGVIAKVIVPDLNLKPKATWLSPKKSVHSFRGFDEKVQLH